MNEIKENEKTNAKKPKIEDYRDTKLWEEIECYKRHCMEKKRATYKSMRGRRWVFENFAKNVPVDDLCDLTDVHINNWLDNMPKCGGRTINTRWHVIRPMIYFHRDKGLVIPAVLYNVEKREEVPPRRGYYTAEEVEKVLRDCNPIQWLLIKIAFDSGMRLSELTNLRLREINDTQLNYTGKGNKQRESYISPITRERLDDYIQRNNITDYVFENPETGKPYGVNTIREKMRKAFIYAGFDGFYPHIMRHSFATDAQRNGASMIELRDMLGHKSVETTEVYLHGLEGHLHKIFDKYKFGIEPKKEQAKTETQASSFEGAIKQFIARLAEELSSAVK